MATTTDRTVLARGLSWLDDNVEIYLVLTFYIYIIAIVGIEVFRRFVLNESSIWGAEAARLMFIYLTWVGMSWGIKQRSHIRIDVLHDHLSERSVGVLYVVSDLCVLALSLLSVKLIVPVIQQSLQFGATTPALRMNRAYFLFAIPLGFGLATIRALQALRRDVADVRAGRPVFKGGDTTEEVPDRAEFEVD
jgi:TRAP-type C4-dicarboxylate transport system permease small subunit